MPERPEARFDVAAAIEVTGETTFEALDRVQGLGHVACLNFASAKNSGRGFLNGSQPQEEALARSSALCPCLKTQLSRYYQPNRANRSSLYLDLAIVAPHVPFILGVWGCGVFRNDPAEVANGFATQLGSEGEYRHQFARVVFAVFAPLDSKANYRAFASKFGGI